MGATPAWYGQRAVGLETVETGRAHPSPRNVVLLSRGSTGKARPVGRRWLAASPWTSAEGVRCRRAEGSVR